MRPPVQGRSRGRTLLFFVVSLGVILLLAGAAIAAFGPGPVAPECPDPSRPCTRGPQSPIGLTASPAPTPRQTFPASSAPPGGPPSAQPSSAPGAALAGLPAPEPASNAAPADSGARWASSAFGFSIRYDDTVWTVKSQDANRVVLSAANGNLGVTIGGYDAATSSERKVLNDEIARLGGRLVGFTEEPDPALQPPGTPDIGYRPAIGVAYVGTVNSPQGPSATLHSVVLAASDSRITVLVSVLALDSIRDAGFQAVDSVLSTFDWGSSP